MKDTKIHQALSRAALDYLDVDFHIETLFQFPEGTYFQPSNQEGEHYSICNMLASLNLIEVKLVPRWGNDGYFRGMNIKFRYKKDLIY